MAPEQLEGKGVDGRADIFAFGALVYEMATGRRAFHGDSQAGVVAAILRSSPRPMSAFGAQPPFEHVIDRCLAKDPDQRWQTARDLKLELSRIVEQRKGQARPAIAPATSTSGRRVAARVSLSALAIGTAVVATVIVFLGRSSADRGLMRLSVSLPLGAAIVPHEVRTDLAISPDGRRVAFVATTDGRTQLWVRSFDASEAHALAGTEDAYSPFWSPDSRFIGFATDGRIQRIESFGGAAQRDL